MSYFLTLRTGRLGSHQFTRYVFASRQQAHASAECAFVSRGAEYLIEDERGPITYGLKQECPERE